MYDDGVALTEGVDYDVTEAFPATIDYTSPHPDGSVYTVDYCHAGNPVTPPHGTLLTPSAVSDINGIAHARVVNPDDDDIVGHIDRITVTTV